jgi:hypothetical protein
MQQYQKNLAILFLLSLTAYGCSGGGGGSPSPAPTPTNPNNGITTNNLNSLLKNTSTSCTGSGCTAGAYFVTNAESLTAINSALIAQNQQTAQFTNNHYAILVPPGTYNMINESGNANAFNLGYYTQVIGVGESMDAVTINPGVEVYNQGGFLQGAPNCFISEGKNNNPLCLTLGGLNNFWRGVENFAMQNNRTSSGNSQVLIFAVSQAAPIRSIHFKGSNVLLCDYDTPNYACGYTSGGFMANSVVDETLIPGSQQQWLSRNSSYGPVTDPNTSPEVAAWNSVFLGMNFVNNPVQKSPFPFTFQEPTNNQWNNYPVANMATTPLSKEKPYLSCTTTCNNTTPVWKVEVPQVRTNSVGIDTTTPTELDVATQFAIVSPSSGQTSSSGVTTLNIVAINAINQQLAAGKNLLFTPGVYNLDGGTLNISHDNTVVLGIGLPSLTCTSGNSCIIISATSGVDLSGFTLDAGYKLTPNLLQVGANTSSVGSSTNPIFLHDIFFRIAETQLSARTSGIERQTTNAAVIYTSNVVGDNLWIWRADHDKASSGSMTNPALNLVTWNEDRAQHGLIVYGNNVTINGLAVEHFQDYQTIWYGNGGLVNFYQSEMPYDVPSLNAWSCNDPKNGITITGSGCASYLVDSNVTSHTANGLGVYTYFANEPIMAGWAFQVPNTVSMSYIMGKWLNGNESSGYANLVFVNNESSPGCLGYGVQYDSNSVESNTTLEYSVLGAVNSTKTTTTCNK